jgi:hypothetical protein
LTRRFPILDAPETKDGGCPDRIKTMIVAATDVPHAEDSRRLGLQVRRQFLEDRQSPIHLQLWIFDLKELGRDYDARFHAGVQ